MPARLRWQEIEGTPDFLYFPACVTRIFGGSSLGKDDMITVMMRIAKKAGYNMALPRDMHGLCCSQIWEHKGDPEGQRVMAHQTIDKFYTLSQEGAVPIICDTTSCTHTLLTLAMKTDLLDTEHKDKYLKLKIKDITQWLIEDIMPKIKVVHKKNRVLLHPTCASKLMGTDELMVRVANMCANEAVVPENSFCCGAAGDRGFIFPEVAKSATAPELESIGNVEYDGYYSLARTCEISMMDTIQRPYESIIYLVDETTE